MNEKEKSKRQKLIERYLQSLDKSIRTAERIGDAGLLEDLHRSRREFCARYGKE